jgi:hypothetical protein
LRMIDWYAAEFSPVAGGGAFPERRTKG